MSAVSDTPGLFDPTAPLTPSGNLRRRVVVSRLLTSGAAGAAFLAVGVLALVIFDVAKSGLHAISWHFLTSNTDAIPGGILDALVGTALIVLVGAVIAVPLGVLAALYLAEFAKPGSRVAAALKLAFDLLQGMPTAVIGLFALGLLVKPLGHDSGFAGSVALAVIMLPLIARTSQEVLRLVPGSLRDASAALGVSHWRTLLGVVLPAAASGIATGAILAIARAAGETAPLLAVCSVFTPGVKLDIFGQGVPNIPVTILTLAEQPSPEGLVRAWGAALTLLFLILVANVGARLMLARSRKRTTGQ
jgi:phosphate transport system permease protein